jgi:hypothetical protein
MTNILFTDILLNGFFDDASLLKEYLIRNQKNAEKETFITQQEFYKRCYDIITNFENKIDYKFYERQNDLYMIADLKESENKPFEKFIIEAEELSKQSFPINLPALTNGRLIGKLYFNDIQYIKNILNEINLNKPVEIENKLSINQIALKLFYEGESLSREKAHKIIIDYGYTSGDALYNKFVKYSDRKFRRDVHVTAKILENKINLFESIIELLPDNKKSLPLDEVKYLKGNLYSLE